MLHTKQFSIFNFQFSNQKGISLLFVVLVMSVILTISLGISSILNKQTSVMREIGYSVVAFYAADSGIEEVLAESDPKDLDGVEKPLTNGAKYEMTVKTGDETGCDSPNYCIKSIGSYQGVKRAIEVMY